VRYIEFRRERRGRRDFWIPKPRGTSPRGRWTIEVCGLDRDPLLDRYRDHVEKNVMRYVDDLRKIMRQGSPQGAGHRAVHETYHRTSRALLGHTQRFIGLSYDALVSLTGDEIARWGFSWPMPD
jgi:hypothetical protein